MSTIQRAQQTLNAAAAAVETADTHAGDTSEQMYPITLAVIAVAKGLVAVAAATREVAEVNRR